MKGEFKRYTNFSRMINFYAKYADKHREDFPALDAEDNIIHAAEQAWKNKAWDAVYHLWEASQLWLDVSGHMDSLYFMLEWAVHASRIGKTAGLSWLRPFSPVLYISTLKVKSHTL